MRIIPLLFVLLFISQVSFGQSWQDTLSLIDKTLGQYRPENPGCQLAISRNGQVIFSRAWGMADMERNVPLSTTSVLEAGSVSKQFTAAAILLLEQQGKLLLDDDVKKYVPELPDYGTPVTLRQMLHHTSGLREWTDIASLTGWPRGKKFYSNKDVFDMIIHQKHLNNTPGAKFRYSNSNYILFAIIVERLSGLTLAAFTKKYIFEPAAMLHTQWRNDPNRIVPNRAIAYSKSEAGFETDMPNEYAYGPGGLLTTSEDLLKWNDFYQSGKLGTPSLLTKQIQTEPLSNGVMNIYGAGLFIKKVLGWNNINHDGATASYRAYLESFPELHVSIALLSNTSQFNIVTVEESIRKIFIPDKTNAVKTDSSISLPGTYLNQFSGLYVNEGNGSTFQLSVKDSHLVLDDYLPLANVSANMFRSNNFLLYITGAKGRFIPLLPRDTIPFTKVTSVKPAELNLSLYEGSYYSEETNTAVTVKNVEGKLTMRLNAGVYYQLIPTYKDAFKINELDCDVQFTGYPKNKTTNMKVFFWRTSGIEFKKE